MSKVNRQVFNAITDIPVTQIPERINGEVMPQAVNADRALEFFAGFILFSDTCLTKDFIEFIFCLAFCDMAQAVILREKVY